jgi:transaldolase / glucose-6-phosphate isomerase
VATIGELRNMGQSVWLNYIRRHFIMSPELKEFIDTGIVGFVSNPLILPNIISYSTDYDETIRSLLEQGKQDREIYEIIVFDDIRQVAEFLLPVFRDTHMIDGYVCMGLNPSLAFNADGIFSEAHRILSIVDYPNVMINIPSTDEGIEAIQELIGEGIHVNATNIFSLTQYQAVFNAYINGLEKMAKAGGDLSKVASVASISINSQDTAIDLALEKNGHAELIGKFAISNATIIYKHFLENLKGGIWQRFNGQGARPQRLLWDGTEIKNPGYLDTLYMENLVGRFTVSNVLPATIQSFLDHGKISGNIEDDFSEASDYYEGIADVDVDINQIARQLQQESMDELSASFDRAVFAISRKRKYLDAGRQDIFFSLGGCQKAFDKAVKEMVENRLVPMIWSHDYRVWKNDPAEIKNRLGWLHSPEIMTGTINRITLFVHEVISEGYTHALVLGMGGSSMAPDVFQKIFGMKDGYLNLDVLDSTDPGAVIAQRDRLNPSKTLFIVSTKSGTTVETLSFFKFFYNWVVSAVGELDAGSHFIAITDSETPLAKLAQRRHFRTYFINDSNIGGRYSALSYFGLVPAALIGVDIEALLDRAMSMVFNCDSCNCMSEGNSNCARLGASIAELYKAGRDKLTFIFSPEIERFSDWIEQLLAESTGKEGKGILPVVGEAVGSHEVYDKDRVFVQIGLEGSYTQDKEVDELERSGHPVIRLSLRDFYDIGGQFFLWEMAVAVASHYLGINPFDQPNVEASKLLAREIVTEYKEKGSVPIEKPLLKDKNIIVYGEEKGERLGEVLNNFLSHATPGAYVAIQAYVTPMDEAYAAIHKFRMRLRDRLRIATTFGYGPRFLHSTGQLYKGDSGKGLFIQLTVDDGQDIAIPDEEGSSKSSMTFGVLKTAQAAGDRKALLKAGRKVICFHFQGDLVEGINRLSEVFI